MSDRGVGPARTPGDVDPATLEIVRHALGSVADEMALIIARTAYSATVRDALDYSTALLNPRGELIAQGLGIALHLGSFPSAVGEILRAYGPRLQPGDVYILNDPYGWGGIHLPDIYLVKPVFHEGRLVAVAACLAHHTDVGGLIPSSNSTTTTEVFQEGIRIPGVHLYEAGRVNQALLDIIAANVRVPHMVLGDLRAQLVAVDAGARGYLDLVRRYGADELALLEDALLTLTERMARREIAAFPDGVYRQEAWIDNDSVDPDPIRIAVTLTIAGDEITVDFGGTTAQVRGGINSPWPFSKSAAYAATRLVLDRAIPNSGGYFRAVNVVGDEGTIVRPRFPAACGARGITGFRIMDAVSGALAQAVPDRVPADGEGGNSIISLGGLSQARRAVHLRRHVLRRARRASRRRRAVGRTAPGFEQREHADRDRGVHVSAAVPPVCDGRRLRVAGAVARVAVARARLHVSGPTDRGSGPVRQARPPAIRSGRRGSTGARR